MGRISAPTGGVWAGSGVVVVGRASIVVAVGVKAREKGAGAA